MNFSVSGFLKPSMHQDYPKERVFQKQTLSQNLGIGSFCQRQKQETQMKQEKLWQENEKSYAA